MSTDNSAPLEKSKNQDKNDAKRKAKMEKFLAKQQAGKTPADAKPSSSAAAPKKDKEPKKPKEPKKQSYCNSTPAGEKKDMSAPMADSYDPQAVESAWYSWWEAQGFFAPKPDAKEGEPMNPNGTFVMVTPPPNVTGKLHIGHALFVSIQDAIVRWNRMRGVTTLFVPGCDHAGISTQVVVEKLLWKTDNLTRHDLGREAFVNKVWDYKNEYAGTIMRQIRRLGASYDWSRERFSLDDMLTRATRETFVRLFNDGIIYRSNRLVNWCHHMNTTLSNLEVENTDLPGPTMMTIPGYPAGEKFEFGVLIHFAYEVENSCERIVVATTRIETMLGDTAIAVHPDDERYKHLHGKFVRHPFVDRRIPIITDAIAVDM
ncbi:valine--tRNA ligase, partial [Coemansia sp. RSA 1694]